MFFLIGGYWPLSIIHYNEWSLLILSSGPFWFSAEPSGGAYVGCRHIVNWLVIAWSNQHEHARHRLLCLHVQAGRKASRALELGDTPQEQAAGRQADWQRLSIRVCRPVR